MAINKAIIQIRRGPKADLQFDKLLPGELAIATDAPCMWFCWAVGEVEQIPTSDNIEEVIAEIIEKYLKDNPVTGISEIYMRVYEGYIQYSSDGEIYNDLISVSELKGAKGDPGSAGVGIRTIKQTTKSSEDGGTNVITITLSNDTKVTFEVLNGKKGSPGNAGVGIQSISQQTGNLNGGKNTIQIVLTNGNVQEVFTYNGKNGSDANVTLANIVKALGFTPASEDFVNNQVSTIPKFAFDVVDSLPTSNIKETTVYLVSSGDESDNLYTEYIYKNGKWEKLGAQTLDLSKYAEKSTTLKGYGITDGATKEQVNQLSQEIVDLGGVVDYVKTEAKEVADKIIAKRTINSLVLLMGADVHVTGSEAVRTAIKHMGQGMYEVCKHTRPDGAFFLGDYNYQIDNISKAQGIDDAKYFGLCIADIWKAILTILMNGNHDYVTISSSDTENRLSEDEVYALIGSYNTDKTVVDVDNLGRNYGYVDFEKQRIRWIYLNTTDCAGTDYTSHLISTAQGQWLINEALDLSDKEDEEEWEVAVSAHIPLYDNPQIPTVLGHFVDRTSGRSFSTDYNFATTKAKFIAVFHAHTHNLKVTVKTTSAGNKITYICIPNAFPGRENPYTDNADYCEVDSNNEPVYYPKSAGTAEDTSFNAVVIDKDNKKIHAICYGAGYDRKIDYLTGKSDGPGDTPSNPTETYYTITRQLTNCTSSSSESSIVEKSSHSETITAMSGYSMDGASVTITMGGQNITSSAYNNGVISIPSVTGDVVITVSAVYVPIMVNQIPISTDANGNVYNGIGYKPDSYLSSSSGDVSSSAKAGYGTTGFIPIGVGSSNTATGEQMIYLEDIEALPNDSNVRIWLYDSSKTKIAYQGANSFQTSVGTGSYVAYTLGDDGYIDSLDVSAYTHLIEKNNNKTPAFFRICAKGLDGESIITVNQPII